jgi:hypothetical protein
LFFRFQLSSSAVVMMTEYFCDKCKKSFQDASQLKNHKGNYHCLSVTVKYNDRQGL